MTTAIREIRLPSELCDAVEQHFGAQFTNIEDLLVFVLSELIREDSHKLDQSDQQMIEARLRDLGYL